MSKSRGISVIVHGPEAVDSGLASNVIDAASRLGTVRSMVGGASAVAAVIDAGLETMIATEPRALPSVAIKEAAMSSELVVLVNLGKSHESSMAFGRLVMRRVLPVEAPVVQLENDITIIWSGDDLSLRPFSTLFRGERLDMRGTTITEGQEVRRLRGVLPGENVWIDGHVIGKAESSEVTISKGDNGELIAKGVRLKHTGVERLGNFELQKAIIRSGHVRRTRTEPRSLTPTGRAACLIDHCAEDAIYRCRDAAYAITVGDDTSKIASALLFRLGVPVIAITDGDEDGISYEELAYPGSYIFRLVPGNDDLVGAEVERTFFRHARKADLDLGIDEMAERVRKVCGDRLLWERRL